VNEPHRSPDSRTIVGWLPVLVASLMAAAGAGCHKSEPAPALQEQPQPSAAQPKSAPLDVGTAYGDVPPPFPKPGWSSRRLRDTLPLCVFPSQEEREKAPFIQNVHEQVLRADAKVVFGVFGPGCLNEACDARPMLPSRRATRWSSTRASSAFTTKARAVTVSVSKSTRAVRRRC
jgi:hypothetical protein